MNYLFVYLPKLTLALSGGDPFRAGWLYCSLVYFTLSRHLFISLEQQEYHIHCVFNTKKFTYKIHQLSNVLSLIEIYVFKEYDWDCSFVPQTILDLGANFGDTALYYTAIYPEAKIIAVEPEPSNFAHLQKNVASHSNIIPVQCAVGAENGSITLHLAENGLGHSTTLRRHNHGSVAVAQATVSEILAQQSITKVDLLKFDIEGAEAALFKDGTITHKARALVGELHFDLNPELKMEDVTNSLQGLTTSVEPSSKKSRFILKAM